MNNKEICVLRNFMAGEKVVYFVLRRTVNGRCPTKNAQDILTLVDSGKYDFIDVNINITKKNTVSLQCLRKSRKSNAIALRQSTFEEISEVLGLSIDFLLLSGDTYVKIVSFSNKKKAKVKLDRRQEDFDDWIDATRHALIKKATTSEKRLYNKLSAEFAGDVDVQCPFVIKGKVYYADILVKSKGVVIEVDGGYHTTQKQMERDRHRDADFNSIGYTTIRCTNEQTKDAKFVDDLINKLSQK